VRIHREGYSIIAVGLLTSVGVMITVRRYLPEWIARWIAVGMGAIDLLLIAFFRDPERLELDYDSEVIAPASGVIVAVEEVDETEYLQRRCVKIAIFLSVLNVHVNVVPISGEVVYSAYHAGKYLAAFHPKSSELNERNTTVIQTATGDNVMVRQIAGIVARRISTYVRRGDVVRCGDELGFIKFGSRVEVFWPLGSEVSVRVGDRVRVGVTRLAQLV
jgi:phosphatidylserine decarboxylase